MGRCSLRRIGVEAGRQRRRSCSRDWNRQGTPYTLSVAPPRQPIPTEEPKPQENPPPVSTLIGIAAAGAASASAPSTEVAKQEAAAVAATTALIGKTAAEIIENVMQFGFKRSRIDAGLLASIISYEFPERTEREVNEIVRSEVKREAEFRRKQRERLQKKLPEALRIADPQKRADRLTQILERERDLTRMRAQAMTERAVADAGLVTVRNLSPEGGYWRLSRTVREHTPDCLAMGEKFWPWQVLDVFHPPLHPGCPCEIVPLDEAIAQGWMTLDQIPNTKDAVARARRIIEEYGHLRETVARDEVETWVEALVEGRYDVRWPKGDERGGQFRPQRGSLRPRSRRLLRDLLPSFPRTPVERREAGEGRWVALKGVQTFIPEQRDFERRAGGRLYTSPAGSTLVYRDGNLLGEEHPDLARRKPLVTLDVMPETEIDVERRAEIAQNIAELERAFSAPAAVPSEVPEPGDLLDRPARNIEEFAADTAALVGVIAAEYGTVPHLTGVIENPDVWDHEGYHDDNGMIVLGNEVNSSLHVAATRREDGEPLSGSEAKAVFRSYKLAAHEALHAAVPVNTDDYGNNAAIRAIEEALTEELAFHFAVERLRDTGQEDVLKWIANNPDSSSVHGSYMAFRARLDEVMNRAKIAPEERLNYIGLLKFMDTVDERFERMAHSLADADAFEDKDRAWHWVEATFRGVGEQDEPFGILGPPVGFSRLTTVDLSEYIEQPGVEHLGKRLLPGTRVRVMGANAAMDALESSEGTIIRTYMNHLSPFPFHASVLFTDGRVRESVLPVEIEEVLSEPAWEQGVVHLDTDGMTVVAGDTIIYGQSEATVTRIIRDGGGLAYGWVIEAVTTENSEVPGMAVILTPERVQGELRRVSLREAADFNPRLHPRDRLGRFRDVPDYVRKLRIPGIHIVGGAVRDKLLGKEAKDHDFIVIGKGPDEIRRHLEPYGEVADLVVAGRRVGVRLYPEHPDARAMAPEGIEFVPPRKEVSTGPKHTDFEIVADGSVGFDEDARRRDFTVNAVAQRLEVVDPYDRAAFIAHLDSLPVGTKFTISGGPDSAVRAITGTWEKQDVGIPVWFNESGRQKGQHQASSYFHPTYVSPVLEALGGDFLDPLGGVEDAKNKVLRVIGPHSFMEDPLRIVRGLRFISQHDLTPDDETFKQMREHADGVVALSGERVYAEINKLLMGEQPMKALRVARDTGVLERIFPELAPVIGFKQESRYHGMTADEHIFHVVQAAADMDAPVEVRWAALFHDSGKPESAWMGPDGKLHYYENPKLGKDAHEVIGARKARTALNRVRSDNDLRRKVVQIIDGHMFQAHNKPDAVHARRFLRQYDVELARDLVMHKRADIRGKESDPDEAITDEIARLDEFERAIEQQIVEGNAWKLSMLNVNGGDLIAWGVDPGPEVGWALEALLTHVVGSPKLNNREWLKRATEKMLTKDGIPRPKRADSADTRANREKEVAGSEPEAMAERLDMNEPDPELLSAAFHDIVGQRVYRDSEGNYRYRKGSKPGGPIAPWSDVARAAYPDHLDLRRAANEYIRPITLPGEITEAYAERLHPRNRLGRWINKLGRSKAGKLLSGDARNAMKKVAALAAQSGMNPEDMVSLLTNLNTLVSALTSLVASAESEDAGLLLQEAHVVEEAYAERLHPRDRRGRWAEKLGLPDLRITEVKFDTFEQRRDLKLRLWDVAAWSPPDNDKTTWGRMLLDIAGAVEEQMTEKDRVFIARNENGNIAGVIAVQEEDAQITVMRLGAVPRGYEPDSDSRDDTVYTDEPPAAHVKGTGTRLMLEAAKLGAEKGKWVRGLAVLDAEDFYRKLGMTVELSEDEVDYLIEWSPEAAREFVEERS